jgi:hypothetical protein
MKYNILMLVLFCWTSSRACDVCGGVTNTSSLGVLASTQYHFIGLKTEFKSFSSYLYGIPHSKEKLIRTEIMGRLQLHRRAQLLISIPLQSAWQTDDFGRTQVTGLGDIQSTVNAILFHRSDSSEQVREFVSIGGGVKWPTGLNADYPDPQKNLYPGTGSLDALLSANMLHRFKPRFAGQMELNYSIKGKDRVGFQYGQSGMITLSAIYEQPVRQSRLFVSVGPAVEWNARSSYSGVSLQSTYSKGWQFAFKASVNGMLRNWLWSIGTHLPVVQYSFSGNVKQWPSIQAAFNYLIAKKSKK